MMGITLMINNRAKYFLIAVVAVTLMVPPLAYGSRYELRQLQVGNLNTIAASCDLFSQSLL